MDSKINLDISGIEFSWKDKEKGIILPTELTADLAEDIGIIIGDGSLFLNRGMEYEITCSGNPVDETEYYNKIIAPLKYKLFNVRLSPKMIHTTRDNEFGIRFWSKAIFTFYTAIFQIPYGRKERIVKTPMIIKNSHENIEKSFLRGIFDTDGSVTFKRESKDVHNYPVLKLDLSSSILIKEISNLLRKLGFNLWFKENLLKYDKRFNKNWIISSINISGKNNLDKWMKEIGFSNSKHSTKYLVWKKFGFCPPNTTLNDRLKILDNELDPLNFENNGHARI